MVKAVVLGQGFVGKTLANSLESHVEVVRHDPALNYVAGEAGLGADFYIICVGTPVSYKGGVVPDLSQIFKAVRDVVAENGRLSVEVEVLRAALYEIQRRVWALEQGVTQ